MLDDVDPVLLLPSFTRVEQLVAEPTVRQTL